MYIHVLQCIENEKYHESFSTYGTVLVMKNTKVQTLSSGHAIANHFMGSEDTRHHLLQLMVNTCKYSGQY